MPSNGRVTKRVCPAGWVCITQPLARELFNKGFMLVVTGNKTDFRSQYGGVWVINNKDILSFNTWCKSILEGMSKVFGRYLVFYVTTSDYERFSGENKS